MNILIGSNLLGLLNKLYEEERTEYVKMLIEYVIQVLALLSDTQTSSKFSGGCLS